MKSIKNIKARFNYAILLLWVKWMIHLEDSRIKAEKFVYKMDDKLKRPLMVVEKRRCC